MEHIYLEPSDSLQIIAGCAEKHSETATCLSHLVENTFHWLFGVCSGKIIGGLDGFDILCIICVIAVAVFWPKIKSGLFHHLKFPAGIVWILGVFVYMIGFNEKGSAESVIALTLRSCLSSMEMFVSHSDLIEVREELHDNAAYMAVFSFVHFLAVIISAIFILRLFGFRMVSWMKITWRWFRGVFSIKCGSCHYYVMFGVNANTVTLAKSIAQSKHNCIIFINMPAKGHSHASTRFSLSHFFHSDSDGVDKYIEDIGKMNALLFNSSRSFENADTSFAGSDVFKVFRALEFSSIVRAPLQKLLRKTAMGGGSGKVEYFFFSENEQENMTAISVLQRLQKEHLSDGCAFDCYCHARKNRNNSAMLNDGTLVFNLHIVDTSNLSVMELKKNCAYHPVNFVNKGTVPGTVSSAFTAMVIGFGEAGRDAFRFLYEFSSFTKNDEGDPSEKKIHIVDKDIEKIKASFLNEAPALRNKPEVEWWKAESVCSEDFWKRLKDVIQNLNYIVITVGNDDEAVDIATSLFEFAYRYRDNLSNFKIFVRLRNSIHEDFLRNHLEFFNVIKPFGSNKTAFSYEVMNNDTLEKKAKLFYDRYEKWREQKEKSTKQLQDNHEDNHKEKSPYDKWKERRDKYISEKDKDKRKELEIKIWYQEEQDRSNVWHIYTKVALANGNITLEGLHLDSGKRLLKNLSDCEHLRWNAKMELLGFEPATDEDIQKAKENDKDGKGIKHPWKSFRLRKHECMVDCRTLHSNPKLGDSIIYDEYVVEVSFKITEEEKNR